MIRAGIRTTSAVLVMAFQRCDAMREATNGTVSVVEVIVDGHGLLLG